jgi:hypothetical protein
MADEATLIYERSLPISFTCSNTVGIEKGTWLVVSDPFTAAAHASIGQMCAGICAVEKIANDGLTRVAVYRDGVFKVIASGSIAVGEPLALSTYPNRVLQATGGSGAYSGSKVVGVALETAADGESFLMDLRIGGG